MNEINVLAQTEKTVTISRADLDALLQALEDAEDIAAVERQRAKVAQAGGWEAYKRQCYTGDEVKRILDGEHRLIVWREKRGLSQHALAEKAGVSPAYISEIEARKKPGSVQALAALAQALDIPVDNLVDTKASRHGESVGA